MLIPADLYGWVSLWGKKAKKSSIKRKLVFPENNDY